MSSPRLNPPSHSQKYVVTGFFHPNYDHQEQQPRSPVTWSSKICHCCHDRRSCWTTFFCPCVTFGRIVEHPDERSSACVAKGALYCLAAALTGCFGACCWGYCNRSKMRTRFRWEQKTCNDCSLHFFCHCCALCQEYRHLQSHEGCEGKRQMRSGAMGITQPPMMNNMSQRS